MPERTSTSVERPAKQEPMEMKASNQTDGIVTSQPTRNQPTMDVQGEPQLGLRGGGLSCGFDCCDGSCRFHKHCC